MPYHIPPTVGRVVWFYPSQYDGIPHEKGTPLAAIVCYVFSDRMVNLRVFDQNGDGHARTSIVLKQEGDVINEQNGYCTWMPYQLNKAKEETDAALEAFDKAQPTS